MLGLSGTSSYDQVTNYLESVIFFIVEQSSLQKYTTCWVFLALRHMLYSCTFVFVYLRICIFCIEKLREYEKSAKKLKNIKKVIKQLNN